MRGWFDAFRSDGGPTLYSFNNRTPVSGDVATVSVCVLFVTLYAAFLVIFPGIRKQKFTTFITVTLSLFVGAVILVTMLGSGWHVASTHVVTSYKAFSKEKLSARLGAHIGLGYVNVTLTAVPVGNWSAPADIDFNERFCWGRAGEMGDSYTEALRRGLPYPILTVAEYFSLGQEGFAWGGQYRAAGYYASILLGASLASWLLMNLLLVAVPRYGGYLMALTGALLGFADLGYFLMLPTRPLRIVLEGGTLDFRLGWCFWLVLVASGVCLLVGLIITTVDLVWPHRFSTILEVYYDTPYDRHVIIEESHDTRYRKRNSKGLEEAPGLGSRILRRLSSKTRDQGLSERYGLDNGVFQQDVPKSPWRYPFRRNQIAANAAAGRLGTMQRTSSQDSGSSMASTVSKMAARDPISPLAAPPGVHKGNMAHLALTRTMQLRQPS